LGNVVGSVAFPLHTRFRDAPDKAAETIAINLRSLVALLLPTYIVLAALAPALTRDMLGPQWAGTPPLVALLAGAAVIGLVADAIFPMLEGRGTPERITLLLTIRTVVLLTVVLPLASRFGVVGAAVATIAAEVPIQIIAAAYARNRLPRPFRGVASVVAAAGLAGAVGAIAGLIVDALVGPPVGVVPAALAAGIASLGTMWFLDRILGLRLTEQVVRVFPILGRVWRRR
jgi:O-antigen/teichoic acid export membrane protein